MEVHQRPQQTPLELNAAGACPPSTSEVRCNQLAVGPGTVYRQTVGGRLSLNECRVAGPVRVHKWDDEAQREAAVQDLQAFCSASIHSLGLESFQPMLLKGAVSDWAAADRWSLDWLVDNFGGER